MLTLRTVFLRLTKGDSERDGAYALLKNNCFIEGVTVKKYHYYLRRASRF